MSIRIKVAAAKSSRLAQARLTAYESDQVSQIATWKSKPPQPLTEIIRNITLPEGSSSQRILPDPMVAAVIARSYQLALEACRRKRHQDSSRGQGCTGDAQEVARRLRPARVRDGRLLANFCYSRGCRDRSRRRLHHVDRHPLAAHFLALRTILKIGHCYGYPLDQYKDQGFVLGVLIAATSGTLPSKRYRLDQLHSLEEMIIRESQEEILADEVLSFLFQLEIFASVPGIGAISGGAPRSSRSMRRVDNTARRVFQ